MIASSSGAIAKPQVYESKRIQLTSPILHIGSEVQRLNPFEYIQTSSKVYLPNSEALARALQQRGRLTDYIRAIEKREDITPLLKATFGDNWWDEKDASGEPLFPPHLASRKWTDQTITDLRPMIRNGLGQFYIPGSSIKGAIRTAIAYHLIKHADRYNVPSTNRVSEIEKKLREKLKQGDIAHSQKKKFLDDQLFMNDFFTDFSLSYQGKLVKSRIGPNTDFMRAVQVTDSTPLIEEKLPLKGGKTALVNVPVVAEVIVSSRFENEKAKYKASLYVEMARNVRTEFTLSLDTEMLSWFKHQKGMKIPFNNLDELLRICQEFAQEQLKAEQFYWEGVKNNPNAQGRELDFGEIREFYNQDSSSYSLRLGWASGLLGTTINLCLNEELVEEIRDAAGISAPGFEAPKSRRTVVSPQGEIKYVPGWVKFKILKDKC